MNLQQGVNPLNGLFNPEGESRRTGALSDLGVQYAGSNGSVENTYEGGGGGGGYNWWSAAGKVEVHRCLALAAVAVSVSVLVI